jgi:hypothetical protein
MTMTKLMVAIIGAALVTGPAMAQTINNAWQYSPAGVQDQVKQAPQVGDPAQVGGTPAANIKGAQSQMQDPRLVPPATIILVPSRR